MGAWRSHGQVAVGAPERLFLAVPRGRQHGGSEAFDEDASSSTVLRNGGFLSTQPASGWRLWPASAALARVGSTARRVRPADATRRPESRKRARTRCIPSRRNQ
jgi:hypothetical protein